MKKLVKLLLFMMLVLFLASPASALQLVIDLDPPDVSPNAVETSDHNGQWFSPTEPNDEEAWLEGLLGKYYDDPEVEFISKDESDDLFDTYPSTWVYAVLKYGVGKPGADNPDHWAIWNDEGISMLSSTLLAGLEGLPTTGLSHISYFSGTPVPEPSTVLLLGLGLVGLAGLGRKKIKS